MPVELKEQLAKIEQRWEDISKEMKPALEKQQNELNKHGEAQKATSSKLDEHGAELVRLQEEHKKLSDVIKELELRNQRPTNGQREPFVMPGKAFAESEAYKTFIERGKTEKWSGNCDVKAGFFPEAKAADFFGLTNVTDLHTPLYVQEIIALRQRMPIMRQHLTKLNVNTDVIYRKREKLFYHLVTKLTAAANSGATAITVESIAGLTTETGFNQFTLNGQVLTISAIDTATNVLTVNALSGAAAIGDLLTGDKFGFTPEASIAVKGVRTFEKIQVPIKKLMVHSEVTNEELDDVTLLEDEINRGLLFSLGRQEDRLMLYGTGGSDLFTGFFSDANVPTVLQTALPAGSTKLDLILYLITVIALAEYDAAKVLVHPNDMRDIQALKGSDGHYLFWQAMTTGSPAKVWATEMVRTSAVDAGDCLAGDLAMAATIYDRQEAQLQIGEPNDTMLRDMKAILAKERLGFAIERPSAAAIGKFS